ncbi:MAG: hypothetical protein OXI67_09690 [Candidatus Poribacteria bacterium]|nr:hypothetical protein [Candidatus Poribacteria bacterium]
MRILQTTLSLILILFSTAAVSAKIIFSSYQNGNTNIYIMSDNGSSIRQFSAVSGSGITPRWSPDGQQIAFLQDTDPSTRSVRNAFIMNADDTNVRQLTNQKEAGFNRLAFSPDGKKLLVNRQIDIGEKNAGLYVVDIKTKNITQISDIRMFDFDWSPDGKEIIFLKTEWWIENHNLWIMNADGTDTRPWIRLNKTFYPSNPRWSPNGQRILYTETDLRFRNGGNSVGHAGTYRYMIRNADGGAPRNLAIPKDIMPVSVAWMNSGRSVLFSAIKFSHRKNPNHFEQLYRYDIATRKVRQLTDGPGDKWRVDWVRGAHAVSPAGKQSVRWGELKKAYSD